MPLTPQTATRPCWAALWGLHLSASVTRGTLLFSCRTDPRCFPRVWNWTSCRWRPPVGRHTVSVSSSDRRDHLWCHTPERPEQTTCHWVTSLSFLGQCLFVLSELASNSRSPCLGLLELGLQVGTTTVCDRRVPSNCTGEGCAVLVPHTSAKDAEAQQGKSCDRAPAAVGVWIMMDTTAQDLGFYSFFTADNRDGSYSTHEVFACLFVCLLNRASLYSSGCLGTHQAGLKITETPLPLPLECWE